MKKRILTFAVTLTFVLAFSVTAFAEERQGAEGWQVIFDGKNMNSNFSAANMDDEIYNMQPGDSVELTIALKSNFNGKTDWYMRNQVLESLEDAGKAEGGAYDYLLTYTDTAGETTTLYSSEYFGGEGRYNGVGLHGATETLDEFFYLDRLGNGEAGTVKLKVRLDGETQGNDYQNTLAKLQMDFATEVAESGGGGGGRRPVRTGDQSRILLYVILSLAAGMTLLIIAIMRLRGEREEAAVTEAGTRRQRMARRRER